MKIQELFNKIPHYVDLDSKIYIKEDNTLYSCEVYSDCGLDFSFEVRCENEVGNTSTIGDMYRIFYNNRGIDREDTVLITEDDDSYELVDVEFEFNTNKLILKIK